MNKLNYPCDKTPDGLCIDCTNNGSLCDFDECEYMSLHQNKSEQIRTTGGKRGKWINGKHWDEWFCSVCHNPAYLDCKENPILSDYCPECGAKMEKE